MSSSHGRFQPAPRQPEAVLPAALTLVVGLGERGGAVVGRLGGHAPFSASDGDPRRHLGRMTLLCPDGFGEDESVRGSVRHGGRFLAGLVVRRLEAMLLHQSVDGARGGNVVDRRSSTTVLVLLLANAEDRNAREVLLPLLEGIEELVTQRLGPIFGCSRERLRGNLTVLPVLAVPYVPASAEGTAIARCIADVHARLAARPVGVVPMLYLLQQVTDLSVLGPDDVEALLESFCLFVCEALGACGGQAHGSPADVASHAATLPAGDATVDRVLGRANVTSPLASAVVSRTETRGSRIRELLRCVLALRVLRSISGATVPAEGVAGRDEIVSRVLEGLAGEVEARAERAARGQVEPLLPSPLAVPAWSAFKEQVTGAFGPDMADPAGIEAPPSPHPTPWLESFRRQWSQASSRVFHEGVLDGLMEELQVAIGAWEEGAAGKDGARARVRRIIDEALSAGPSRLEQPIEPTFLRRAAQRAALLRGALRAELQAVVAARDGAEAASLPSIGAVEDAHADLLNETRELPGTRLLAVGAALTAGVLTLIVGASLPALASAAGSSPESWVGWSLTNVPYPIAVVLAVVTVLAIAAAAFVSRYRSAALALRRLDDAVRHVYLGGRGSLQGYLHACALHSWHVARAGALARLVESVERDVTRLGDVERALVGAEQRYRRRLAALDVGCDEALALDVTRIFDDERRPLVWSLPDADTVRREVGAAADKLPVSVILGHPRLRAMLEAWRDELPFLQDEHLDAAVDEVVDTLVRSDFWGTSNPVTESAREGVMAFTRSARDSLPLGLGPAACSGIVADGVLLPDRLRDVRPRAVDGGAAVALLHELAPTDRVYAVRIQTNLDPSLIEWWPRDVHPARSS